MMTDYRVYRFDGGSRIELAEWIEASCDDDAIRQTHQLGKQAAKCELWQGKRLIVALGRQDLARMRIDEDRSCSERLESLDGCDDGSIGVQIARSQEALRCSEETLRSATLKDYARYLDRPDS